MGDAYSGRYRHPGRPIGTHHDVITHVLRRRPQWTHARVIGPHQCQMHVADAFPCIFGKFSYILAFTLTST